MVKDEDDDFLPYEHLELMRHQSIGKRSKGERFSEDNVRCLGDYVKRKIRISVDIPNPTQAEKRLLSQQTGKDTNQIAQWFARKKRKLTHEKVKNWCLHEIGITDFVHPPPSVHDMHHANMWGRHHHRVEGTMGQVVSEAMPIGQSHLTDRHNLDPNFNFRRKSGMMRHAPPTPQAPPASTPSHPPPRRRHTNRRHQNNGAGLSAVATRVLNQFKKSALPVTSKTLDVVCKMAQIPIETVYKELDITRPPLQPNQYRVLRNAKLNSILPSEQKHLKLMSTCTKLSRKRILEWFDKFPKTKLPAEKRQEAEKMILSTVTRLEDQTDIPQKRLFWLVEQCFAALGSDFDLYKQRFDYFQKPGVHGHGLY